MAGRLDQLEDRALLAVQLLGLLPVPQLLTVLLARFPVVQQGLLEVVRRQRVKSRWHLE
jgi:hypothetical protein